MQFKNPEILYFLFLLIIPILIHLFQLQKFQKIAFTNVKLLKEIKQQTRKSSQLKKLLILLSRILLLTCLIFAFSEPFFTNKNNLQTRENIFYLDNSFSMQAKGAYGSLLQKAKNDLIENYNPNKNTFTLITNNQIIKNIRPDNFKNAILNIDYNPLKKNLNTVLLQIENLNNTEKKTPKNIFLISDFQKTNQQTTNIKTDSTTNYFFIKTKASSFQNIALDSVWISENNKDHILLNALVKSYQMPIKNLSISLFLNNNLYGKSTVNLNKNKEKIVVFNLPNTKNIHGKISIEDHKLYFDNVLYFNVLDKEKTNVLAIENAPGFLTRIYTAKDFNFTSTPLKNLDYSVLQKQQTILLNEIDIIPKTLIQSLKNGLKKNMNLVIIPSLKSDINSYNNLFSELHIGKINTLVKSKKIINTINYTHPFFKDVFQKQITNFQYPIVHTYFESKINHASALLQFEDKKNFISEIRINKQKIYWIASSLNIKNSNFTQSALVVPIFYNFSLQSANQKKLYYTIGKKNTINLKSTDKNAIHIENNNLDFIPLQSKTANSVKLQLNKRPLSAGIFQIKQNKKTLQDIAFNYDREESNLSSMALEKSLKKNKNIQLFSSLDKALKIINDQTKIQNLWQLFIIFALLFFGLEIILQKFLKN